MRPVTGSVACGIRPRRSPWTFFDPSVFRPSLFRMDVAQRSPLIGLQCALSIAAPLVVGILAGHSRVGGWGAVGAFFTDMAMFQPGHRFRARIVAGTGLLVAIGGFLGAACGIRSVAIYPVVAVWTLGAGLLVAVSPQAALIGVSSATALVYAASLDVSVGMAAELGVVMALSGLATAGLSLAVVQVVGVARRRRSIPNRGARAAVARPAAAPAPVPPPTTAPAPASPAPPSPPTGLAWLRQVAATACRVVRERSPSLWYAARLAVTAVVGTVLYRVIDPADGFWIPEAALFVMRPDRRTTERRAVLRVVGSVAGAALTTGLLVALSPGPVLLAALAVGASAIAFSVQRVNFGLYITFVTCIFVLLTAFGGLPERAVVVDRVVDNVVGSVLALAALWLWPVRARPRGR